MSRINAQIMEYKSLRENSTSILERETDRDRQTERETERDRDRQREEVLGSL